MILFIKILAGLLIAALAYYSLYEAYRWFRGAEIVDDFMNEENYSEEEDNQ